MTAEKKITKRTYALRLGSLTAQLDVLEAQEKVLDAEFDALAKPIDPVVYEEFHVRYHANETLIWDKKNEIGALHSEWRTRNWTAADWNHYELVANNID